MRNTNYFALDLELNNLKNGQVPKIIQVGVAIGSPLWPDDINTHSWYIDPQEPISPFITDLTGITDEIIQSKAVDHHTVAKELGDLITGSECFTNPVTWGQGDADELKAEFDDRGIDFPFFGRRIFDVKTIYVFQQMVRGKALSGGLRKSMISYGMRFIGRAHNAEYDALNTLRFLFHFMERQRVFEDHLDQMKTLK
jgi:hypothetical protein